MEDSKELDLLIQLEPVVLTVDLATEEPDLSDERERCEREPVTLTRQVMFLSSWIGIEGVREGGRTPGAAGRANGEGSYFLADEGFLGETIILAGDKEEPSSPWPAWWESSMSASSRPRFTEARGAAAESVAFTAARCLWWCCDLAQEDSAGMETQRSELRLALVVVGASNWKTASPS